MKKLWKRSEDARTASLRVMKAALLVAVAIISGCLIVAYLGETIIAVGLWLLNLAVMMALGLAIGSICYTLVSRVYDKLMEQTHVRNVANVIYPWGKLHPDLNDASFAE